MNSTKTQSRTGKIARLPHDIREQLNQRLLDNHPGSQICQWLNSLSETKAVCLDFARQTRTRPLPIDERNLSNWRRGGFQDWLRDRQALEQTRQLAKNDHPGLAEASAVLLNAQLLKMLQALSTFDWAAALMPPNHENTQPPIGNQPAPEPRPSPLGDPLALLNTLSRVVSRMRSGEHNLKRLSQRDQTFSFERHKYQNTQVALAMKILADQRAKEIESQNVDNAPKLEMLGRHMYGDLWTGVDGYSDHWYSYKSIEELEAGYDGWRPTTPRPPRPPGIIPRPRSHPSGPSAPAQPTNASPSAPATTPPRTAVIPSTPDPRPSHTAQSASTAPTGSPSQPSTQTSLNHPAAPNSSPISPHPTSSNQKTPPASATPPVHRSADLPIGPNPATQPPKAAAHRAEAARKRIPGRSNVKDQPAQSSSTASAGSPSQPSTQTSLNCPATQCDPMSPNVTSCDQKSSPAPTTPPAHSGAGVPPVSGSADLPIGPNPATPSAAAPARPAAASCGGGSPNNVTNPATQSSSTASAGQPQIANQQSSIVNKPTLAPQSSISLSSKLMDKFSSKVAGWPTAEEQIRRGW